MIDTLQIFQNRLKNDPMLKLDKWQRDVLAHNGNVTIRAGRQVGKSTVISLKTVKIALENPGVKILIVAASQRQSSLLFEKVLAEFSYINELQLKDAGLDSLDLSSSRADKDKRRDFEKDHGLFHSTPTKTRIILKDGTEILSLPVGKTGIYIKGYSVDVLIADEAAFIPEMVWLAINPMIAVSKKLRNMGWMILLSTPFGKGGYYYSSHYDDSFKQYHINSELCPRIGKDFLKKEKARLSRLEYAQEYQGEFIDEFSQFFSSSLIKGKSTFIGWDYSTDYRTKYRYYLGVDIARYGADENAFCILEWNNDNKLRIVKVLTTERRSITDTVGRILKLHDKYDFRKIFIDDAGVGGGAYDLLKKSLRNRLVGLNNASKSIENKRNRILKEDLYSNALVLLEDEKDKLTLVNDLSLQRSLLSMQYEYTGDRNIRIYGRNSHIAEAFVRACWATKAKGLKCFIA